MMERTIRLGSLSAALGLAIFTLGCGDDDPTDPQVNSATAEVSFRHVVDATPVTFDSKTYQNAAGDTYSVKTLQYILTDVSLVHSGGNVELSPVQYVDAFDADTESTGAVDVGDGTISAVTFTWGLDCDLNVGPLDGGTLPTTSEWQAMLWPTTWGGGYHYMKLEGDFVEGSGTNSYLTHIGRRHAMADSTFGTDATPTPHYFTVTLAISPVINVSAGTDYEIDVVMNVNEWYTNPNTLDMIPQGIMMNTAMQNMLEANGASVFTLGDVNP